MNKIFKLADGYVKRCGWKDLALVKFCLCAMGIIIGLSIPAKRKKQGLLIAASVFLVTYIPLMADFIGFCVKESKDKNAE